MEKILEFLRRIHWEANHDTHKLSESADPKTRKFFKKRSRVK